MKVKKTSMMKLGNITTGINLIICLSNVFFSTVDVYISYYLPAKGHFQSAHGEGGLEVTKRIMLFKPIFIFSFELLYQILLKSFQAVM